MIKGRLLVSPVGLGTYSMQSIGLVELARHDLGQYGVCNVGAFVLFVSSEERSDCHQNKEDMNHTIPLNDY
jgi:hypothetical protein